MCNKWKLLVMGLVMSATLAACGQDPQFAKFKSDVESFCDDISSLDSSMNQIDPTSATAKQDLLEYLDEVDMEFRHFAELDFPDEFDYLEPLADEASEYMVEAVKYYHDAYTNEGYNETNAEYAKENYTRAFRRIQIIISFLHGEEPEGVDVSIVPESEE